MTTLSLDLLDWKVDNVDTDSAIDRLCTFLKTLPELRTLNIHIGRSTIESAKLTTLLEKLNGRGICHLLKSAEFWIEKFSSDVFAQLVEFASIETLEVYSCSNELPPLEDIVTFLQRMPASLSYFRIEATEYSKSEANKRVKTKIPQWLIELSRSEEFEVDLGDIYYRLTDLPLDPNVVVESRPPSHLKVVRRHKELKEVVPIFASGFWSLSNCF